MTVVYALGAAAILLVIYRQRGPKVALGRLAVLVGLYVALAVFITSRMP